MDINHQAFHIHFWCHYTSPVLPSTSFEIACVFTPESLQRLAWLKVKSQQVVNNAYPDRILLPFTFHPAPLFDFRRKKVIFQSKESTCTNISQQSVTMKRRLFALLQVKFQQVVNNAYPDRYSLPLTLRPAQMFDFGHKRVIFKPKKSSTRTNISQQYIMRWIWELRDTFAVSA